MRALSRCPLWVISGHFAVQSPCPLYLRKRTCAVQLGMSAMGQKRTFRHSFDHLGRTPDYRVGDVDAERLYGLQVS